MQQGWIKVYRQIQDCEIWIDDSENFDKRSAWIDLLLSANHRDKQIIFDGKPLIVGRGQYVTSVRKLAARWGWGNQRTLKYLRLLEELGMITKESDSRRTLISIVNYEVYQDTENANRTLTDTVPERKSTTNKNIKNEKNVKNNINPQQVVDLYSEICISLPKVQKLSDTRKRSINARLKKFTLDDFKKVFELAEESDFLTGRTSMWQSNFDWLINESNMIKVLEGNYRNKDKKDAQSISDLVDLALEGFNEE